ncbi:hypothetical protein VKI21_15915 [Cyanobacterium aponinum UTEX 3222]|uniref:Secreted protein n=2 Tax=Cyanobacterium TaxID=102234 RepID=A0AAF1C2I0_9CHRO|nr:hypothetical protein [Cyanobacterium aponinum]MBD2394894.1 hypothetical protein [Cyanobacterium aponinum FACHB-4101]WPF89722.1 hypothetical protein SAY89_05470 [Cyanobacterium aponinum AL20115]WRL41518.1 hypothetical protein VKI21_15915 [Cyanobacterium aponinum UTEX 3222]
MNQKFLSLFLLIGSLITTPSVAQMNTNIDDLPNDSSQDEIWYCTQNNKEVLVEVKSVNNWQEVIEKDSWQCVQELVSVPDNMPQFSCENDGDQINLITLTWLKGEQAKTQMKSWIDAFQKQDMICTTDETNPFWQ